MPKESNYAVPLDVSSQRAIEKLLENDPSLEVFVVLGNELKEFVISLLTPSSSVDVVFPYPGHNVFPFYELDVGDRTQPIITYTNTEKKALLAEVGASFCSLILLFDEKGDSFLVHDGLVGSYTLGNDSVLDTFPYFKDFIKLLDSLKDGKRVFLTATNVNPQLRNKLVNEIRTLVSKDVEVLDLFSFSDEEIPLLNKKNGGTPVVSDNALSGLFFVPKFLSRAGKNQIVLLGDKLD
ncbi:MAG: hypothetical protein ABFQ62_00990 [Patescibacteria group bacterium]